MGFLLIPSEFPTWLRWAHTVPVHTYSWRSFMYIEFSGSENVFDSVKFPTGMDVLRAFEIDDVDYTHDMLVLVGYGAVVHLLCIGIILLRRWRAVRILKERRDEEEEAQHDGGF